MHQLAVIDPSTKIKPHVIVESKNDNEYWTKSTLFVEYFVNSMGLSKLICVGKKWTRSKTLKNDLTSSWNRMTKQRMLCYDMAEITVNPS